MELLKAVLKKNPFLQSLGKSEGNVWSKNTQLLVSSSHTGLRKVKDEEKTHKNKELRKTGPVPDKPKPAVVAPKPKAAAAKKPPVFELQGKKWAVVSLTYFGWYCSQLIVMLSAVLNRNTNVTTWREPWQ